ncbi:hypothetical protein RB594_003238 [Gaeumannomyces avenae]
MPHSKAGPGVGPPPPSEEVERIENSILAATASAQPGQDAPTVLEGNSKTLPDSGESQEEGTKDLAISLPPRPAYGTQGRATKLWANYVELTISGPKGAQDTRAEQSGGGKGKGKGGRGKPPRVDKVKAQPEASHDLYKYGLSIDPPESGYRTVRIIQLLLEDEELQRFKGSIVSDFKTFLVSHNNILADDGGDLTVLKEFGVRFRHEDQDAPADNAQKYRVVVKLQRVLSVATLRKYLTSEVPEVRYGDKEEMLQALNIFLNHYVKVKAGGPNVKTTGSNRTFVLGNKEERLDLTAGLEAVRGFFSSVRPATGRMLINVNVTHACFYQGAPLTTIIHAFDPSHGRTSPLALSQFLSKLKVKLMHLDGRIKTIQGVATSNDGIDKGTGRPTGWVEVKRDGAGPQDVRFRKVDKKAGKNDFVTVSEYFKKTYNYQASNDYPAINHGTLGMPSYVPADACVVLPGQLWKGKLRTSQIRDMIKFAVRKPDLNAASIVGSGLDIVGASDKNEHLTQAGFSAKSSLITVPSRVLPSPILEYFRGEQPGVRDGGWKMTKGKYFAQTAKPRITSPQKGVQANANSHPWTYVILSRSGDPNDGIAGCRGLYRQTLEQTGLSLAQPTTLAGSKNNCRLDGNNSKLHHERLDAVFQAVMEAKVDFVLFVLPDDDTATYNSIKYLGDVVYGVHTICALRSKICDTEKWDVKSYLAMKIYIKLGGVNHRVSTSNLGLVAEGKTMIVGIDVTHPSPGQSAATPSVAAMVASRGAELGQWPGEVAVQSRSRDEMVSELRGMMRRRLQLWRAHNGGRLPENIIVYRDGVSEGQYRLVLRREVPELDRACAEVYGEAEEAVPAPRVAVVIVGKRHHTRFYPAVEGDTDRGNARPGTVVDRGVTEARVWDFYLQSHSALQGTARPAHYVVIRDDIFNPKGGGGGGGGGAKRPESSPGTSPAKPKAAPGSPQGSVRGKSLMGAMLQGGRGRMGSIGGVLHGSAGGSPGGSRGGGSGGSGARNPADELEALTHSLCYVFGRATKAVSIVTPTYYADILCERARCYMACDAVVNPSAADQRSLLDEAQIRRIRDGAERARAQGLLDEARETVRERARRAVRVHENITDEMFYI